MLVPVKKHPSPKTTTDETHSLLESSSSSLVVVPLLLLVGTVLPVLLLPSDDTESREFLRGPNLLPIPRLSML